MLIIEKFDLNYIYELASIPTGGKQNITRGQTKDGVIFAQTNILARFEFGASLTNNDVANNTLTDVKIAKDLYRWRMCLFLVLTLGKRRAMC